MAEPGSDAAQSFRRLASATIDDLLAHRPEWATMLGDHRFDDQVDDLSEAGLAATAALLRRRRGELAAIDRTQLDADDRVDLAILCNHLERMLFDIDELALYSWDPLAYNAGESIYFLLTRDVLPLPDRLRAIAARLALLPERIEHARRQLDRPPRVHLETALAQLPGIEAMVGGEVSRLCEDEPSLRRLVEPAQRSALDALESFATFLREGLDGVQRDPRIGADLFARRLSLALASPLSPAELLARAMARIELVQHELAEAGRAYLGGASSAGSGASDDVAVIRQALGRVSAEAPDDRTIVAAAEAALARCIDLVRSERIVRIPDEPCRIEVMPEFRRGVAVAYCDPAGPLEEGGETHFAIAPTPEDWTAERKASFYREYNSAMVENLTVHEAMPGHVLQLAHNRSFRGTTLVRRVMWSGTFVEGWAVHAERIMAEHGLGGLPVRLQQLKMQLRVAINAVLDVSVHAEGMAEPAAMELMQVRGYQEEGEAAGKWRRALLTSSQLSTYFVGYSELEELFGALGDRLDYDEVLAHGSPPPALLAELLGAGPAPRLTGS